MTRYRDPLLGPSEDDRGNLIVELNRAIERLGSLKELVEVFQIERDMFTRESDQLALIDGLRDEVEHYRKAYLEEVEKAGKLTNELADAARIIDGLEKKLESKTEEVERLCKELTEAEKRFNESHDEMQRQIEDLTRQLEDAEAGQDGEIERLRNVIRNLELKVSLSANW